MDIKEIAERLEDNEEFIIHPKRDEIRSLEIEIMKRSDVTVYSRTRIIPIELLEYDSPKTTEIDRVFRDVRREYNEHEVRKVNDTCPFCEDDLSRFPNDGISHYDCKSDFEHSEDT